MQDQLTDHLDQQLKSTSLENFSNYLKNLQQLPSLQDFFSVYIAKHDLKISQIIKNSGISQSYAHEILNGTPPSVKSVCACIQLKFDKFICFFKTLKILFCL